MTKPALIHIIAWLALLTQPIWQQGVWAQERDCSELARNGNDVPTNHINRGLCALERYKAGFARSDLFIAQGEFEFVLGLTKEEERTQRHIAYLNLGVVHMLQDNDQLATTNFLNAIREKPDYAEAYFNLGAVYYKQKLLKKAEEAFLKAIELQPNYGRAHYSLGFVYLDQKKFDLATKEAEKAQDYGVPYNSLREKLKQVAR